jgi:DNA-directed RNA polymerase alpha subunit
MPDYRQLTQGISSSMAGLRQDIPEVMKVRNLGRKSLEEVLAKLKELNLELNQGEE